VPQEAARKSPGLQALRDGFEPKNHPSAAEAEPVFDTLIGTAKSRALSKPLLFKIPNPNAIALPPVRIHHGNANCSWDTGRMNVIFLSGPIGAGKSAVAQELIKLLPAPLIYIEGDIFWSFIQKEGAYAQRDSFPVLMRSMTAAAIPFARSGFRVLIDFSIPTGFVETARKILKEVPFEFVLLRPSLEVCVKRAATRKEGAIADRNRIKDFYPLFADGPVTAICDDTADPASLARRIFEGLNQGRFRVP